MYYKCKDCGIIFKWSPRTFVAEFAVAVNDGKTKTTKRLITPSKENELFPFHCPKCERKKIDLFPKK